MQRLMDALPRGYDPSTPRRRGKAQHWPMEHQLTSEQALAKLDELREQQRLKRQAEVLARRELRKLERRIKKHPALPGDRG